MHDRRLVVVCELEFLDDRVVVDTDQPFPCLGRRNAAFRAAILIFEQPEP